MARILAIDYGKKKVGLAATDELQIIASALDTISRGEVIDYLEKYLNKEEVECFVIGIPKKLDNTPSEIAQAALEFAKHLERKFKLPVHQVDERFTSKMAFQTMIDSGINKKKRQDKNTIDKISATILLQSFMERKTFP